MLVIRCDVYLLSFALVALARLNFWREIAVWKFRISSLLMGGTYICIIIVNFILVQGILSFLYFHRPPTKLWEGNVFNRVRLSVHRGGGPHVTIIHKALNLTDPHPYPDIRHGTCWWHLVAITGDLFKLVHFRTPHRTPPHPVTEPHTVGKWAVCLLLECFLRVATVQGKQGIWFLLFSDRENTGNFAVTQAKFCKHRENIFTMIINARSMLLF